MADVRDKLMVRLRNEEVPLNIALSSESKGDVRTCLMPNQWTAVDRDTFNMLKAKFEIAEERHVTDFVMTPNGPIKANRNEPKPGYTIEFKGD